MKEKSSCLNLPRLWDAYFDLQPATQPTNANRECGRFQMLEMRDTQCRLPDGERDTSALHARGGSHKT